jgi:hypothetical protein
MPLKKIHSKNKSLCIDLKFVFDEIPKNLKIEARKITFLLCRLLLYAVTLPPPPLPPFSKATVQA